VASGEKLLPKQNSESRIRACVVAFIKIAKLRWAGRLPSETLISQSFAPNENCTPATADATIVAGFMNSLHFSQVLVPGLIAGVLSVFTSWLWMGSVFHRFQKVTPQTWRPETGLSHAVSSGLHILAAVGIAVLFTIVARDQGSVFAADVTGGIRFALACWCVFALPIVLGAAIYINLHPLVVLGQLLDWLSTSLLATAITAWWQHR
jgi:hypothetical protein